MAKKNDSYNSGYSDARKLAHEVGAEPEHHAYGGKMGHMPIRAPRLATPRVRSPGGMPMPGGPAMPGTPGLGTAPGPMPMPGGAPGGPPMMKHGGKAHKKMAKGGEAKKDVHKHEKHLHKGEKLTKLAAGGGLSQVIRRGGAAGAKGPMTRAHIVSPKVKSRGKNAERGG